MWDDAWYEGYVDAMESQVDSEVEFEALPPTQTSRLSALLAPMENQVDSDAALLVHLDCFGDPMCGTGFEPSGGLGADTPLKLPAGHRLTKELRKVTCAACRSKGSGFVGSELVHLVEGGRLLCRGRLDQYEQMVELSRYRAGGSAPSVLITCAGCLMALGGSGATVYPVGVRQADWRLLGAWKRWLRQVEASGGVDAYVEKSMAVGHRAMTLVQGGLASPESVREALQTLLGQMPADADLTAYNTVAAFVGAMLGPDDDDLCECGARKGAHMVWVGDDGGSVFKCTRREGVFTAVGP